MIALEKFSQPSQWIRYPIERPIRTKALTFPRAWSSLRVLTSSSLWLHVLNWLVWTTFNQTVFNSWNLAVVFHSLSSLQISVVSYSTEVLKLKFYLLRSQMLDFVAIMIFINRGQNYWALIGWERGHFFLIEGIFSNQERAWLPVNDWLIRCIANPLLPR